MNAPLPERPEPLHDSSARKWTSLAAAAAAVLGMGSCIYTLQPVGPLLASIAAIAIAGGLFAILLRVVRTPRAIEDRERAVNAAATVGFAACIRAGYCEPYWLEKILAHDPHPTFGVVGGFGIVVGGAIGGAVGTLLRWIGRSLWL